MKRRFTFRSTVLDPARTLTTQKRESKGPGFVHATLLNDALAGKFRMVKKPRLVFPIAEWLLRFTAAGVQVELLVGKGTGQAADAWEITIYAGNIIENLLWRKKVSAAINEVIGVIREWITGDTRLSEFLEQ